MRWKVAGKDHQDTFNTNKLAEGHRSDLLGAVHSGEPFNVISGLPASMAPAVAEATWLEHAVEFLAMKWPDAAPKYRKSLAESLTGITMALIPTNASRHSRDELRRTLYGFIFARPKINSTPPESMEEVVKWLRSNSRPISDLGDPQLIRDTLEAISQKLDGKRAASSTIARRRSTLHSCLDYAVERKRLPRNPLDDIKRKRQPPEPAIDPRRVANPEQAGRLLKAAEQIAPELRAYFAVLYYCGTRPAEAINLRQRSSPLGWCTRLIPRLGVSVRP